MVNARDLIVEADRIAKGQGLTQAEWCKRAGLDAGGMAVCRTYKRGDCKLTTLIALLKPLGYKLIITEGEQ